MIEFYLFYLCLIGTIALIAKLYQLFGITNK
jgi:hypothetical protein